MVYFLAVCQLFSSLPHLTVASLGLHNDGMCLPQLKVNEDYVYHYYHTIHAYGYTIFWIQCVVHMRMGVSTGSQGLVSGQLKKKTVLSILLPPAVVRSGSNSGGASYT